MEAERFNQLAPQAQGSNSPFNLGALLPENSKAGLGTIWAFTATDSGVQAIAYDGKVISGFHTLEEAQTFISAKSFPWAAFDIQSQDEQTTTAVSETLVAIWPTGQRQRVLQALADDLREMDLD